MDDEILEFIGLTLSFRIERGVLLLVQKEQQPLDEEWNRYITAGIMHRDSFQSLIVFAETSPLTSAQRKRLVEELGPAIPHVQTAVLTRSMIVHAICTTLSWFDPKVKSFKYEDLSAAYDHADVGPSRRYDLSEHAAKYRMRLACFEDPIELSPTSLLESLDVPFDRLWDRYAVAPTSTFTGDADG